MRGERLYRGHVYCTICKQEQKPLKRESWNLVRQDDGTYVSYCQDHKPEGLYQNENLCLVETSHHFEWRLVTKVTIHKLDPNSYDRRGKVVSLEVNDIPNYELARHAAVSCLQGMMLLAHEDCVIQSLGETGEQHSCWIDLNYRWERPAVAHVQHKYWGEDQIKAFCDVCRLMARIHKWELVDETVNLLDRIVEVLDD